MPPRATRSPARTPTASVSATAAPAGMWLKTVSQAINMPDAAITLSTPRSIMPTRTTSPSPTAMTIRKLELVSTARRLLTVRKDGASRLATAQMMTRKAKGAARCPRDPPWRQNTCARERRLSDRSRMPCAVSRAAHSTRAAGPPSRPQERPPDCLAQERRPRPCLRIVTCRPSYSRCLTLRSRPSPAGIHWV